MASKGILLLAILLCYLSYQGKVKGAHTKLSMKEELEIEKQLKLLNKPALKSIKMQNGDIYDCVDFYKQPAFDHPLLKNHSYHFQMRPSTPHKRITTHEEPSRVDQFLEVELQAVSCPVGTVPIRRTSKEDLIRAKSLADFNPSEFGSLTEQKPGLHRAVLRTRSNPNKKYNGAGALISIYNPFVSDSQYSSGQITIQNGRDNIQVGWTVNPSLYGDTKTRLFTFFTAGTSSCFNTRCPGFVIVSRYIPLDAAPEISHRGGPIYVLNLSVFRYAPTGDWWLAVHNTDIGFWPNRIFTGLKDLATYVEWGGEAFSPPGQPSPEMGSGHYPKGNTDLDGFCGNITIVDEAQRTLPPDDTESYTDKPRFYRVEDWGVVDHAGRITSFGGPGDTESPLILHNL